MNHPKANVLRETCAPEEKSQVLCESMAPKAQVSSC